MSRKSGLGKGLASLIPSDLVEETVPRPPAPAPTPASGQPGLREVPLDAIVPNPRQPRTHFDDESLRGLADSITQLGVLQPVLVRDVGDGRFELIAGERRWRASRLAGRETIPVIVRDDAGSDDRLLEQALVENLHRDDLNPLEEAAAYQQLIDDFGLTQEAVATRVGKSRAAVANTLRLFGLPSALQRLIADGTITAGHGRALLGAAADPTFQLALARRVVTDGLTVRQVEDAVRAGTLPDDEADTAPAEPDRPAPAPTSPPLKEPGLLELEHLLSDHLDTRVHVSMGGTKGRVQIEFADLADLERIYRRMVHT